MQIEPETSKGNVERIFGDPSMASRNETASRGSSSSAKTLNDLKESAVSYYVSQEKSMPILKKSATQGVRSSSPSLGYQNNPPNWANKRLVESSWQVLEYAQESSRDNVVASRTNNAASSSSYIREGVYGDHIDSKVAQEDDRKYWRQAKNGHEEARGPNSHFSSPQDNGNQDHQEYREKDKPVKMKEYTSDVKKTSRPSLDSSTDDPSTYSIRDVGVPRGIVKNNNKLKHANSVQLPSDTAKNNTEFVEKPKRTEVSKATHDGGGFTKAIGLVKGKTNNSSDSKVELESQIEMLKEELREAAAVEVGLYSVVAEHGSSANKIHAPARRLSRFYFHACRAGSRTKKANAARTAISGFILVSKACGNDVPRYAKICMTHLSCSIELNIPS